MSLHTQGRRRLRPRTAGRGGERQCRDKVDRSNGRQSGGRTFAASDKEQRRSIAPFDRTTLIIGSDRRRLGSSGARTGRSRAVHGRSIGRSGKQAVDRTGDGAAAAGHVTCAASDKASKRRSIAPYDRTTNERQRRHIEALRLCLCTLKGVEGLGLEQQFEVASASAETKVDRAGD